MRAVAPWLEAGRSFAWAQPHLGGRDDRYSSAEKECCVMCYGKSCWGEREMKMESIGGCKIDCSIGQSTKSKVWGADPDFLFFINITAYVIKHYCQTTALPATVSSASFHQRMHW